MEYSPKKSILNHIRNFLNHQEGRVNRRELATAFAGLVVGNLAPVPSTPISGPMALNSAVAKSGFEAGGSLSDLLDDINEEVIIDLKKARSIGISLWRVRVSATYPVLGESVSMLGGDGTIESLIKLPADSMVDLKAMGYEVNRCIRSCINKSANAVKPVDVPE